jgi:hypothetical protein
MIKKQYIYWLVVSTPPKNMKVSWDDSSQLNGKSYSSHVPVTTNQKKSFID